MFLDSFNDKINTLVIYFKIIRFLAFIFCLSLTKIRVKYIFNPNFDANLRFVPVRNFYIFLFSNFKHE